MFDDCYFTGKGVNDLSTFFEVLSIILLLLGNKLYLGERFCRLAEVVEALIGQSLVLSVPETSITLQKVATVEIRVFHFAHDVVDQVLDPIAHLCPESGQQLIGFESHVFPGFFEIGWEFKTSEHLGYIFFIEVGFDVVIVKLFHADRTGATFVLWTVLDCAEQFGSSGVIAHINYYQRS